jgi:hypothetical protein
VNQAAGFCKRRKKFKYNIAISEPKTLIDNRPYYPCISGLRSHL